MASLMRCIDKALEIEEGKTYSYSMTGAVEEFIVPENGIYMLEVWGAAGGGGDSKGGYSKGYIDLSARDKLYICVGGTTTTKVGGYNGGGDSDDTNANGTKSKGGGGCTHIARMTGTLYSIGEANKSSVLIVAGGGGGWSEWDSSEIGTTGDGGGKNGGNGRRYSAYNSYVNNYATGGTQTAGGYGSNNGDHEHGNIGRGKFGKGANGQSGNYQMAGGGGGGWYGGGTNRCPGGGGSGYIGGVPSFVNRGTTYSPSATEGVRIGNGKAKITFVEALA